MDQIYEAAGFFEFWNPDVLLVVIVIGLLYNRLTGSWRSRFKHSEAVPLKQKLAFYTGLVLFYIGQGSPIDYLGHHYMFSVHMLQQSILFLIMPIFILTGTPEWLMRPLLSDAIVKHIISFFTRPLIAIFVFNMLFSIYHLPYVMDTLMNNDMYYLGYHVALIFSAFMMWFPVFTPVEEMSRLTELKKLAYIFGNGVLLTPACALIIFSDTLLYEMYKNVVVPFDYLSAIDDQQLGGVIMKIIQEIVYGSALAYIFFKWYKKERSQEDDSLNHSPGNWNQA